MSVTARKLHWIRHDDWADEPVLVVTARGIDDVLRLAEHLTRGQVEFAAIGFKAQRGLKRGLGAKGYQWLLRKMHGDGGFE